MDTENNAVAGFFEAGDRLDEELAGERTDNILGEHAVPGAALAVDLDLDRGIKDRRPVELVRLDLRLRVKDLLAVEQAADQCRAFRLPVKIIVDAAIGTERFTGVADRAVRHLLQVPPQLRDLRRPQGPVSRDNLFAHVERKLRVFAVKTFRRDAKAAAKHAGLARRAPQLLLSREPILGCRDECLALLRRQL